MNSLSRNTHTDKPSEIVKQYSNVDHGIIKMKPVDIKSETYLNEPIY